MNTICDSAETVPGGVYLCQVDQSTSCGACCGLYNIADISRQALETLLTQRTTAFTSVPRQIDALDRFARKELESLKQPQPFKHFHHCPFVGFIGSARRRVGCLLHPLADGNFGVDYRGLSYYGGMACRDYFCPTTRTLNPEIKKMLRNLDIDWYAYGLIVTEAQLHRALFEQIESQLTKEANLSRLNQSRPLEPWLKKILMLKLIWPFRPPEKSLCHYLFDNDTFKRPEIDYQRIGARPSRYNAILRELDSQFETKEDLIAAEAFLQQILNIMPDEYLPGTMFAG